MEKTKTKTAPRSNTRGEAQRSGFDAKTTSDGVSELSRRRHAPARKRDDTQSARRTGGPLTAGLEAVRVDALDRASWLALRRRGLGGSDAAAVVGRSKWSSPYVVWAEKTGRLPDAPDTEAMRLGRDLEDYVARRFTELTGKRVRRLPLLLRSPRYPFALADVDRAVMGERAGLECKTTSTPDARPFREGFPAQYRDQCLHYLAVTGWDRWYLAVLVLGRGFFVYTLERDEAEITALMEAERRFWTEHVVAGKAPEPDASEATAAALGRLYPQSAEKAAPLGEYAEALEDYSRLRAEKKALEGRMAETENRLKAALGDAERGETGRFTVTWRTQKRQTLQAKALEQAHPDLDLKPFYRETATRVLKITENS